MTPKLAQAVDPIFLHVLDLIDRVNFGESIAAQDERLRIRTLIDQAEAVVGADHEWDLAKYALVSWIDEMMVDAHWDGREWWSNNVLEMEFFSSRACSERFYLRAKEAAASTSRDALEVYYICVVLGFRGVYHEPNMAAIFAETHGLALDLDTWAYQTAMSIRLGQGRPAIDAPAREVSGAPPLVTRATAVWPWVFATMIGTVTLVYYTIAWSGR